MNKQQMARATVIASVFSLVVTPLIVTVCVAIAGPVSSGSIFVGALMSTVFFAISGITAVMTWEQDSFRKPLMRSYALKVVVLLLAGLALGETAINREIFAVSAVSSAVIYLTVQVIALSRGMNSGFNVFKTKVP